MASSEIEFKNDLIPAKDELIELYKSVNWGHANCPNDLFLAVKNSTTVITAWYENILIGLGRAISDSTITVYFPDLLIKPEWQGKSIGTKIMNKLLEKYSDFHNQVLIAEDEKARSFYINMGFTNEKFALSIMKPFRNEKIIKIIIYFLIFEVT